MNQFLISALALAWGVAIAAEFHVSPDGKDSAPGSKEQPFATLERARDALKASRAGRGAGNKEPDIIWLDPGIHRRSATFELKAEDSGTADSPVVFRSAPGGTARLHAGLRLPPSAFKPLSDPALAARLDPAARGKVVELDLAATRAKNIKRYPATFTEGGGILSLFFNDREMPLSRWPNEGFTTIQEVLDKGDWSNGPQRRGGKFIAREDRLARWQTDSGVWLEGYWVVPWEPTTLLVKSIEPSTRTITFAESVSRGIGSKYAKPGQLGTGKETWCAVNLIEEIDRPGEWCIRFDSKKLYFWPPSATGQGDTYLADFTEPMVRMDNASHIRFERILFEGGLGDGIRITGGDGNLIAGCTLRSLGGDAVRIIGGTSNGIRSCDLHDIGKIGVLLSGGDRKLLKPCHNFADNNRISRVGTRKKTYAAAIHVGAYGGSEAIGCLVTHNFMHDLPHAAVLYGGNDHLFEFNEVARVALTSGDVGAFYTWHDWTSRGNIIRHNFVRDSPAANAFYMDDGDSGDTVTGNIVYRCQTGPFIGGGHDNIVRNNIIIESMRGLHMDSRGVERGYATNKKLIDRLDTSRPLQAPWSTRYPELGRLLTANSRALPSGNIIENNITIACKTPVSISGKPENFKNSTVRNNPDIAMTEAGFLDPAKLDFRLRPDSGVIKKIPDFKPIPLEQIGLKKDAFRTTLPSSDRTLKSISNEPVFDSHTDMKTSNQAPAPSKP
jgi:hypothetical protein